MTDLLFYLCQMRKAANTIIGSLGIGFFIIGMHQIMTGNWQENYWILMIALGFLGWYRLRTLHSKEKR